MTNTCSKCGGSFDENSVDDQLAKKYAACQNCWNEWMKQSIMVINEFKLDLSMPEHRQMLKKYERAFFGAEEREAGMKDLSDESQRVPDKH